MNFSNIWKRFIERAFVLEEVRSFIIIGPSSRTSLINSLAALLRQEFDCSVQMLELPYPTNSPQPKDTPKELIKALENADSRNHAVMVFSAEGFRTFYHLTDVISSFRGLQNKTPCISFHDLLSDDDLTKLANVDLFEINTYTQQLVSQLKNAKKIRLKTTLGTDLSVTPRSWSLSPIAPRFNGSVGFFPVGQVYTAPVESESSGRLVVDRLISEFMIDWREKVSFPKLTEPITLEIEEGKIVAISGGKEAAYLEQNCLSRANAGGRILCELTFGTNPIALKGSSIAAEDCARDTFHVGFGENRYLGGKNEANVHWDAVVEFDQSTIVIE